MIVRIKKDRHYRSNYLLRPFKFGREWSREYVVAFDDSARYELTDNKTQVNKLLGVGQMFHHWNSVRIGWRYRNEKIELFLYKYTNGQRLYFHVCSAAIGEEIPVLVNYTIKGKKASYRLKIGNIVSFYEWEIERWFERIPFLYECFPYFGGVMPAPQEIKIKINKQ